MENNEQDENVVVDEEVSETNLVVEDNNEIKISNEVVAVIAGVAVSEVPGVAEMSGGFAGITEVLSGKKNLAKGIKVEVGEKTTKIDVNIVVEYGTRIPDIAYEIQERVKKSVENMTGLKVLEVNVHVQGVVTPDKLKERKSIEAKNEAEVKLDDTEKSEEQEADVKAENIDNEEK